MVWKIQKIQKMNKMWADFDDLHHRSGQIIKIRANSIELDLKFFFPFNWQFVASTSANWLIFDLGICSFFPGIIIPALVGILNEANVGETLSITPHESSWLGNSIKIPFLFCFVLFCFLNHFSWASYLFSWLLLIEDFFSFSNFISLICSFIFYIMFGYLLGF